jgi:hypothetical protein
MTLIGSNAKADGLLAVRRFDPADLCKHSVALRSDMKASYNAHQSLPAIRLSYKSSQMLGSQRRNAHANTPTLAISLTRFNPTLMMLVFEFRCRRARCAAAKNRSQTPE